MRKKASFDPRKDDLESQVRKRKRQKIIINVYHQVLVGGQPIHIAKCHRVQGKKEDDLKASSVVNTHYLTGSV